jgi:hypothetical protein
LKKKKKFDFELQLEWVHNKHGFNIKYLLVWKESCPCCFDCWIPKIRPVALCRIEKSYCYNKPDLFVKQIEVMDDNTGNIFSKTIHLYVHVVNRVLQQDKVSEVTKNLYGEDLVGFEFKTLFLDRNLKQFVNESVQVWELIRTNDNPSIPLSLKRVGCLDKVMQKVQGCGNNNPQLFFSKVLTEALRKVAGFRKSYSGRTTKNITKFLDKNSVLKSAIRVNRTGGSNGYAHTCSYQSVKTLVTSSLVTNCLPRNNNDAVIVWPYATSNQGLWIGFIPFYVGVKKSQNNNDVVSCRYNAVPSYGFVSQGDKLLKHLQCELDHNEMLQEALHIFTATTYNGARILKSFQDNGIFNCCTTAVCNTLNEENSVRRIVDSFVENESVLVKSLINDSYHETGLIQECLEDDFYFVLLDNDNIGLLKKQECTL